jgi:hypothetical protein
VFPVRCGQLHARAEMTQVTNEAHSNRVTGGSLGKAFGFGCLVAIKLTTAARLKITPSVSSCCVVSVCKSASE